VIGRNEGERLRAALRSVGEGVPVVYVDSGSCDGSVESAAALGADVVELDAGTPFTAARARNRGWTRLLGINPGLRFVQFLDGDCTLDAGWLAKAAAELEADPGLAVVCGRRRERKRDGSSYNRLCDMEWNTPVGEARSCGGDAMMRAEALRAVGGFRDGMIAGEEPELCARLRGGGWRITRVDAEMTLHDAAMTRFSQWWRRALRAGHAYAEGAWLHGRGPLRHNVRRVVSVVAWGAALPAAILGLAWPTRGLSLGLLGLYGILWLRIAAARGRRGDAPGDARLYATFCVVGKFAELLGIGLFVIRRVVLRREGRLIEYKGRGAPPRFQGEVGLGVVPRCTGARAPAPRAESEAGP
jgi:GT2 family glycosyltransferase